MRIPALKTLLIGSCFLRKSPRMYFDSARDFTRWMKRASAISVGSALSTIWSHSGVPRRSAQFDFLLVVRGWRNWFRSLRPQSRSHPDTKYTVFWAYFFQAWQEPRLA